MDKKAETIEICPVCEPLSYYQGKSGLIEAEGPVCKYCVAELNPIAMRFDSKAGTNYFPIERHEVECEEYAKIFNFMFAATDSLYSVVQEGCNYVFLKNPAIPRC